MRLQVRCLCALMLVLSVAALHATPVTGTVFNTIGSVGVSGVIIDWFTGAAPSYPPGTSGTFFVTPPTNGSFAGSSQGTIKDLTNNSTLFPTLAYAPPPGVDPSAFPITGFMQFNSGGPTVDLTYLPAASPAPCTGSEAPGVLCSPYSGSPFEIENSVGGGVTIILDLESGACASAPKGACLEAYTGTSGTNYNAATPYQGQFSTQFSTVSTWNGTTVVTDGAATVASILAGVANGDLIISSYAGSFSLTPVPEPGTAFLAISGLLVGAGLLRRRRNRA